MSLFLSRLASFIASQIVVQCASADGMSLRVGKMWKAERKFGVLVSIVYVIEETKVKAEMSNI
jgi:hypothetical protein